VPQQVVSTSTDLPAPPQTDTRD